MCTAVNRGQTSEHHEQRGFEERNRGTLGGCREWQHSSTPLGYKEITLKSDTEQSIIAFRNRVAENYREATLEHAVKGDKLQADWLKTQ